MRSVWCEMCGKATEMKFYYKIYRSGKDVILAVCDRDILGKIFEEGNIVLNVKKEFYKGEEIGEEVLELFNSATIINRIGTQIVNLAIANKWVEKENVLEIKGVKHAQIIKI